MLRKSMMAPRPGGALCERRVGRVSADEARALGTTLTAVGAEKAGNKGRHDPRVYGTDRRARELRERLGVPRRSVRVPRNRAS